MDRRLFLKNSFGALYLLTYPGIIPAKVKSRVTFGLITDLHFADRDNIGTRYYRDSRDKLLNAISLFNEAKPDFLIELGDLKDQGDPPDKIQTLTFLDEIEKILQTFNGPVYHVLGNHDMDSISKNDFLKHTYNQGDAKSQNYYSFVRSGIRFIVLDANYNADHTDYDSGNFDWTISKIPDKQLRWLKNELGMKQPSIIFIHQLLDSFSGVSELVCVKNADEVVKILEVNKNVLAVFQGHHHAGHYSFRNGIHYFTMKAMVEGAHPENNSYAIVEIDKDLNIAIDGFYNCGDLVLNKR